MGVMASRFSEFLSNEKIDPRRVLVASRAIERLRPEDRAVRWNKRNGKKSDAKAEEGAEVPTRRSGRVVTNLLLSTALEGGKMSGPQKTRLLRAVNRVLEQKKKDPTEIRKIF